MKKFKQIRDSLQEASMKISGIKVEVKKSGKGYKTFVDGDELDTYSSEKEGIKMAKEFIKQYKG